MSADPADLARERAAEVQDLIGRAEELEQSAREMKDPEKLEDAVTLGVLQSGAANFRARAICIHLRLPTPTKESP